MAIRRVPTLPSSSTHRPLVEGRFPLPGVRERELVLVFPCDAGSARDVQPILGALFRQAGTSFKFVHQALMCS